MDIADWRKQIDEIDRKLVELINQRAKAAHEIGKLKSKAAMPIYEPDRERSVFSNVCALNHGPLADADLLRSGRTIRSLDEAHGGWEQSCRFIQPPAHDRADDSQLLANRSAKRSQHSRLVATQGSRHV